MPTLQGSATTNAADLAIRFAVSQVGKPYRWGAIGPDSYDCSGLIQTSYKHAGIHLTRTTYTMIHEGKEVKRNELQPGDLIFPNPGHVQLYIGGGKVCEAPEAGVPVRVVPIWGFWRARRVTEPGTGSSGSDSTTLPNDGQGFSSGVPVVGNLWSGLSGIVGVVEWITNGHNWLRIAEFIAGAVILFTAIASVTKGS